jgi:hypothetical protein
MLFGSGSPSFCYYLFVRINENIFGRCNKKDNRFNKVYLRSACEKNNKRLFSPRCQTERSRRVSINYQSLEVFDYAQTDNCSTYLYCDLSSSCSAKMFSPMRSGIL